MSKKIVIVAGEESGDKHASVLVKQLLAHDPFLEISGIGGQYLEKAGVTLINYLARYSVTGLTAALCQLRIIKKAFTEIKQHLQKIKPDLLILVDYPGFNLRLAQFAKQQLGLRIVYYISPQIWAWKANRIHIIHAYVDHMAVILPFEKEIYKKAGIPCSFVGHPLIEKIAPVANMTQLRKTLNLPLDKKIVAFLPGSRRNEIEKHMPILQKTIKLLAQKDSNLHFVIPIAISLDPTRIKRYFPANPSSITFLQNQAISAINACDCAVVASGTASLECALLEKPMCIIYKGSLLNYIVAMKVIRVKYLGLCNLLMNKLIVPEFLQYDCNPQELIKIITNLLYCENTRRNMIAHLQQLKTSLSQEKTDASLFEVILEEMYKS